MDVFRHEIPRIRFLAVEKLSILYNFLTTLLIIVFYPALCNPRAMFMGRFFILVLTIASLYLYCRIPSKATRYLRLLLQISFLNFWYPETFEFSRMFGNYDHLFASLDLALFGCQPSLMFGKVCDNMFWRELFCFGYWMFYPMIMIVVTYFFFLRPRDAERCSFVVVLSFFIYYIVFMFVPVAGPQFYFPVITDDLALSGECPNIGDYFDKNPVALTALDNDGGLFECLVKWAQSFGERPTAAFPSSHVGIATITIIFARRMGKWFFAGLFVIYLVLCFSTVYIRAHYLVDVIAGAATGFLLYWLTSHMFEKFFSKN